MPAPEPNEPRTCAVCGRSIPHGEGVVDYLSPENETTPVCALCRDRVQALGWVPADSASDAPARSPHRRRWFGGLRARRGGEASDEEGKPR